MGFQTELQLFREEPPGMNWGEEVSKREYPPPQEEDSSSSITSQTDQTMRESAQVFIRAD